MAATALDYDCSDTRAKYCRIGTSTDATSTGQVIVSSSSSWACYYPSSFSASIFDSWIDEWKAICKKHLQQKLQIMAEKYHVVYNDIKFMQSVSTVPVMIKRRIAQFHLTRRQKRRS